MLQEAFWSYNVRSTVMFLQERVCQLRRRTFWDFVAI